MTEKQKRNKYLIEEYPFLTPIDWGGKRLIPEQHEYEWTVLDDIPEGWAYLFGEKMCKEIKEALLEDDLLEKYGIGQAKEKWGGLRWYDYNGNEKVSRITDAYEQVSYNICSKCGKPDVPVLKLGWIIPMCEECYYKIPYYEMYKTPYEDLYDGDTEMPKSYKVRIFHNGGYNDQIYDLTKLTNELRELWKEKQNERGI